MRWIVALLLSVVLAINALPSDVEDFESDVRDEDDDASLNENEDAGNENEADEADENDADEAEDPAELTSEDDPVPDEFESENDPRPAACRANHKRICKTRRVCPKMNWVWKKSGPCRDVKTCNCVKCVMVRRLYYKCNAWGSGCRYKYKTECSYVKCIKGKHLRKTCHGQWFKKKCHWYYKHFCKG